jgi:hypothetical protein
VATALHTAVHGLWDSIEQSRGAQLLTYEITTYALRAPGLSHVARRQYAVTHAAVTEVLTEVAATAHVHWVRPVDELAGEVLAVVDGVTLRWLADRDGAAARSRLAATAAYLATQVRSARRAGRARSAVGARRRS